jgi:hypothetical protein
MPSSSRHFRTLFFILVCLASSLGVAHAEERVALVIGNSHYGGTGDVSGIKDAELMREALIQIGFPDVTMLQDGSIDQTDTALKSLGNRIKNADVVVFFFSGHGFQIDSENYLMPIGSTITTALPLSRVKNTLAWAPRKAVKLVFLDACRKMKSLPADAKAVLKEEQAPVTANTLYAFAGGPDSTTPAEDPDGVSAYTRTLLHYLNQPGLKISEILDKVASDSALEGRLPSYVINGVPSTFYLRKPVYVKAEVSNLDGRMLIFMNGDVVFDSSEPPKPPLIPLRAGHNDMRILMSKGKSYHNGHTWDVTEGWGYDLKLGPADAPSITCSGAGRNGYCFSGHEDHPFKDGPHHGEAFVAAEATFVVDGNGTVPNLRMESSQQDLWNTKAPIPARDQGMLFKSAVTSLGLTARDLLVGLNISPPWNVGAEFIADDLLKTGMLFGKKIADPNQTYAMVWGNKALLPAVQSCMTDQATERREDFKKSMAAVFSREPKPFEIFDEGLERCVRARMAGGSLKEEDIQIWTAIHDVSNDH